MASANDNFTLVDGLDHQFKVRAMDVSGAQDGSVQAVRHLATPYPVDYGAGGCYLLTSKSGVMAAGLASAAPVYAFRWTSATFRAILRRVRVTAWSLGTGFTAGLATFDIIRATSWTVADTGGTTDTLTAPNGKLRTAMAATLLSEIRHSATATLTAGTRTLDAQPFDSLIAAVSTAINTPFISRLSLFDAVNAGEHPLVLSQNEGFVIQATVPATGTWTFAITPEWDEVPLVNY